MSRSRWPRLAVVLPLAVVSPIAAQEPAGSVAARAIVAWFRVDPSPLGRPESAVRVTQPTLMGSAWWKGIRAHATVSFEGLTIRNGEPAPGAWGEGFVDRRHPHTYLHEFIVETVWTPGCGERLGACRFAVLAGKGFVPFGSDDPMSRPFVRFPVNHHLAQVLERALVAVQAGAGPFALEAAVFNGDEPERPGQWPNVSRFGDSWSARLSLTPVEPLELSGSAASVASPEHRPGAGAKQSKTHVSGRLGRLHGERSGYALLEWARTSELDGFFVFQSVLAEGGIARGGWGLRYRFERTDRPEEERLTPYRAARPHLENTILGRTRWSIHTVGGERRLSPTRSPLGIHATVELSRGRVRKLDAGIFDPVAVYGKSRFWSATVGVRIGWRDGHHAMGRYGIRSDDH